jgi:hypothetical protein
MKNEQANKEERQKREAKEILSSYKYHSWFGAKEVYEHTRRTFLEAKQRLQRFREELPKDVLAYIKKTEDDERAYYHELQYGDIRFNKEQGLPSPKEQQDKLRYEVKFDRLEEHFYEPYVLILTVHQGGISTSFIIKKISGLSAKDWREFLNSEKVIDGLTIERGLCDSLIIMVPFMDSRVELILSSDLKSLFLKAIDDGVKRRLFDEE